MTDEIRALKIMTSEMAQAKYMIEQATLRDQFAMAALTGYCAYNGYIGHDPAFRAHHAYTMADAMLAAREEKK